MKHKIDGKCQSHAIRTFSHGVFMATLHMRRILSTGHNLVNSAGTVVTLKKAVRRRRNCMRLCKLALDGFIR